MTDQQDQGTPPNQSGADPQEQTEERLKRGQDPNQFFQTAKEELKSDRPPRPQTGDSARPDLSVQGYSFGSFQSGNGAPAEAKAAPPKQPGFFEEGSGLGTESIVGAASAAAGSPQAPGSGIPARGDAPRASSTGLTPTQSQFFDEPMDPQAAVLRQTGDAAPPDPRSSQNSAQEFVPSQGGPAGAEAKRQIDGYFPDAGSSQPFREPYETSPQAPSMEFDEDEATDEEYEPRRPSNRTNEEFRGKGRLPIIDSRPEKEAPRRKEPPPRQYDEQEQSAEYLYDEEVKEKKKREAKDRKLQDRSDRFNRLEKLVTPETKSILTYAFLQAKEILLSPKSFFATLPDNDDVGEAAMFLFICAAAGGLLAGFVNFNLLVTPGFFFCNVVSTFLIAAIRSKVIPPAYDKANFPSIFRVVAYSQAACFLIAGLKLGPFGLLTLIPATIYSIKLQFLGFENKMNVPKNVVMFPLIGTTIFLLIVRWKLGCL